MNHRFQSAALLAAFTITLCTGCASTPPAARQTIRPADLQTPEARKAAADQFWSRVNVPDLRGRGYKRIAIAEFTLEFVRTKCELTADLDDLIKHHPELAKKVSGTIQNVDTRYPNEFDFPAILYKLFCNELATRGLEVIPSGNVTAAASYRRFETVPSGTLVPLQDAAAGASDTGRVKSISLRSLPELSVLRSGGDQEIESIESDLLRELKADVVLRVRIRVGTFSGHATLERGSTVHVCTSDVSGTLFANRSLVSDGWIISDAKQNGGVWEVLVNLPNYDQALRSMFPAFIAMGFESAESAPKAPPTNATQDAPPR